MIVVDKGAGAAFGAALAAAVGHAWAPEPWDIAMIVLTCLCGSIALALFAAGHARSAR
jgi:hypothetical protein